MNNSHACTERVMTSGSIYSATIYTTDNVIELDMILLWFTIAYQETQ